MNVRAQKIEKVIVTMDRSDVVAMLMKAGMVPETFGQFWKADLAPNDGSGGLVITFEENVAVNHPPKLK